MRGVGARQVLERGECIELLELGDVSDAVGAEGERAQLQQPPHVVERLQRVLLEAELTQRDEAWRQGAAAEGASWS